MTMSDFRFGEVALLRFPFTDGIGYKKRPALILADTHVGDVILSRITGQIYDSKFDIKLAEWKKAGLKLPSVVRLHKIVTISADLIERKMGKLGASDLLKVKQEIQKIISEIA